MRDIQDLIGKKFNKLTVIQDMGKINNRRCVLVQCECKSKEKIIRLDLLEGGNVRSCGCLAGKHSKLYNTYDLTGDYGIGYTTKGMEFYFDLEDYDKIKDICWLSDNGYIRGTIKDVMVSMHNLVMNNLFIDHIYHNKNDNRKENLRVVTNHQNMMNIKSKNKYGIKGIGWDKVNKKWLVTITIDGKLNHLGRFIDITYAVNKRIEAEKIHYGEYRYVWEHDIKWDLLLEYEKTLKGD